MNIKNIVNPGYGWRLLNIGEWTVAGRTELLSATGWKPQGASTYKVESNVCRVPIDPGDGYELVPEFECPKQFVDQVSTKPDAWENWMGFSTSTARELLDRPGNYALAFRRRIAPKVEVNAGAVEDRAFVWLGSGGQYDHNFHTQSEARKNIARFIDCHPERTATLLRAVSKFERIETKSSEIRETKI